MGLSGLVSGELLRPRVQGPRGSVSLNIRQQLYKSFVETTCLTFCLENKQIGFLATLTVTGKHSSFVSLLDMSLGVRCIHEGLTPRF